MKEKYTITLDKEKVDDLKVWFDKNGQTFSGYLNSMIGETLQALNEFAPKGEKVTFYKLLSMASKMTKTLKKEMKK